MVGLKVKRVIPVGKSGVCKIACLVLFVEESHIFGQQKVKTFFPKATWFFLGIFVFSLYFSWITFFIII